MNCECVAYLNDKGTDREALWRTVMGVEKPHDPSVPIVPEFTRQGGMRFVRLDLGRLTTEQRKRLIMAMAEKFEAEPAQVADSLIAPGIGIEDKHLTIVFCRLHTLMMQG